MGDLNRHEVTGARAKELFESGFNCAESVLMAVTEGLEVSDDLIPRIATGFGGGICGCGHVCGAVTGAVMAAGTVLGRDESGGDRKRLYSVCQALTEEFVERFSSVACLDLVGVDWRDPVASAVARKNGVLRDKCAVFVEYAASRTAALIASSLEG
jgi:C_GCAxxG_C_C family probable redox protein